MVFSVEYHMMPSAKESVKKENAIQCHLMLFGQKLNFSAFKIIKMPDAILFLQFKFFLPGMD